MTCHQVFVSHSLERQTDGSVAHRWILRSLSGKDILALA
jgi:hypothetical protein